MLTLLKRCPGGLLMSAFGFVSSKFGRPTWAQNVQVQFGPEVAALPRSIGMPGADVALMRLGVFGLPTRRSDDGFAKPF